MTLPPAARTAPMQSETGPERDSDEAMGRATVIRVAVALPDGSSVITR